LFTTASFLKFFFMLDIIAADTYDVNSFVSPFKKGNVERVVFTLTNTRSMAFREGHTCSACVSFRNGATTGEQEFYADGLPELTKMVHSFINSL
jgi:hypothetical protein